MIRRQNESDATSRWIEDEKTSLRRIEFILQMKHRERNKINPKKKPKKILYGQENVNGARFKRGERKKYN